MAKMFERVEDENGVDRSRNAHREEEYEHPESRMKHRGMRYVRNENGVLVAESGQYPMSCRVKDQVLGQTGKRVGTMTFDSELNGERR